MRLHELAYACRLYRAFTDYDSSLDDFRRATGEVLDLANGAHRKALLVWLNSWGCRQFSVGHHTMASDALKDWGRRWVDRLPAEDALLPALPGTVLDVAGQAYGDLSARRVSLRARGSRKYPVTFGPTGAAKVLFALRPSAFPPWDDPIRERRGYDGSPESYPRFLRDVQGEVVDLQQNALGLGISVAEIPARIGRPDSSLPKLIDEYYWVTVTKGCRPLAPEELELMSSWAGGRRISQG
jgi:hypothetical protein